MAVRLLLYLAILLVGGFIGFKELANKKIISKLDHIQSGSLLFLLFIMGIRIGLDDKVISSFLKLGVQALVLSVFSIVFSVLLIKLVSKYI